MKDAEPASGSQDKADELPHDASAGIPAGASPDCAAASGDEFDESLFEEASALIDDTRTYVEAELTFQKTRAKLAGSLVGTSLALVIVALILLHIAFLALAVGLVIALEPLVTIWGAIAIVFGGTLAIVGLLCWMAYSRARKLGDLFSASDGEEAQ